MLSILQTSSLLEKNDQVLSDNTRSISFCSDALPQNRQRLNDCSHIFQNFIVDSVKKSFDKFSTVLMLNKWHAW